MNKSEVITTVTKAWVITGGHKEGYGVQVLINGKIVQMEFDTGAIACMSWYHNRILSKADYEG